MVVGIWMSARGRKWANCFRARVPACAGEAPLGRVGRKQIKTIGSVVSCAPIGVACLALFCVVVAVSDRPPAETFISSEPPQNVTKAKPLASTSVDPESRRTAAKKQPKHKTQAAWQIATDGNSVIRTGALTGEQIQEIIAHTSEETPSAGRTGSGDGDSERDASVWWVRSDSLTQRLKKHLIPQVRAGCKLMASWKFMPDVKDLEFESGNMQIVLYKADSQRPGKYLWHVDIDPSGKSLEAKARLLTVTVQLSSPADYKGGSLQVGKHVGSRERGSIIIFPSYVVHQVQPVTFGSRYALVCWFHARGGGRSSSDYAWASLQHYQALRSGSSPIVGNDLELSSSASLAEGNLLNAVGMAKQAESAFKAGLSFSPSSAALTNGLGAALGKQGRHIMALKQFEIASRLAPNSAVYRHNLELAREAIT